MNKIIVKIASITCCAALGIGCISAAYAVSADQSTDAQETENVATATTSSGAQSTDSGTTAKDETVYVLTGADGSVQKIIVSDWLKNALGSASLSDVSSLTDILNVKGDETFTTGSGDSTVWDAEGNDIYYQGTTTQELPVTLTVSYKLDGSAISADELAGKSGKVTIRYEYQNNQYEMVDIDGSQEKMYVPFAVMTGLLLDNDVFRNVEVTNGRSVNDGDRTVVLGAAFPGLQENLAIDEDKLEIPDYLEITADVTDFSLGMSVTVATNQVFSDLDITDVDSADDLTASLGDLGDAMTQLMDGSTALYDGLSTLYDKSGDLVDGVGALSDGAKELKDGAASLDDGAGQIESGLGTLSSGLNELSENNDTLNDGAKTVFETLLSTANTQLAEAGLKVKKLTIKNYATVLNGVIDSLDETNVYNQALEQVTAAVEANRSTIKTQVTAAVREQVEAKVTEAVRTQVEQKVTAAVQEQVKAQVTEAVKEQVTTKVTEQVTAAMGQQAAASAAGQAAIASKVEEQMATADVQALIASNTETQMQTADVQAMITSNTDAQMKTADVLATIKTNTDAQMKTDEVKKTISDNVDAQVEKLISENMASDTVQSQLSAASEGAKSIISLKASLDSYNAFYKGLQTYTAGVSSAAKGAAELYTGATTLADGTGDLKDGASDLYDGVGELKDGVDALVDGVQQLKDGASELSDGLSQFNEEGIQKLIDAVDGDVEGLITRFKATVDVSKNYRNFSGISDDMDGQVTFIYRTDEIKAAESEE
jgi:putative membrane protein